MSICASATITCSTFSPLCRNPRLRVYVCVFTGDKRRVEDGRIVLMHTMRMPLFVCQFHSPGISDMSTGSSAVCLPTAYPSIALPGTHDKSLPGIWVLPEMLTSTINVRVNFVRVMMAVITRAGRRIMSPVTESCHSSTSTLAYRVQSPWMEEISGWSKMELENLGSSTVAVTFERSIHKNENKHQAFF